MQSSIIYNLSSIIYHLSWKIGCWVVGMGSPLPKQIAGEECLLCHAMFYPTWLMTDFWNCFRCLRPATSIYFWGDGSTDGRLSGLHLSLAHILGLGTESRIGGLVGKVVVDCQVESSWGSFLHFLPGEETVKVRRFKEPTCALWSFKFTLRPREVAAIRGVRSRSGSYLQKWLELDRIGRKGIIEYLRDLGQSWKIL